MEMSHNARVMLREKLKTFVNTCHDAQTGRFCETHGVYHSDEGTPTGNDLYMEGRKKRGVKTAHKALGDIKGVVGSSTKEGIVVSHAQENLLLQAKDKEPIKAGKDVVEKIKKADSWLDSNPPEKDKKKVESLMDRAIKSLNTPKGWTLIHIAGLATIAGAHFLGFFKPLLDVIGTTGILGSGEENDELA